MSPALVRWPPRSVRGGFTLVELLVVLVLLALLSGVAGVAFVPRAPRVTWRDRALEAIARARSDALARGEAVSITVAGPSGALRATAFPDGRVVADDLLAIEPATGRRVDSTDAAPTSHTAGGRREVAP